MDFGFATQKTPRGAALCKELNLYLQRMKKSGEYDALRKKWEDPDRKGDQMGDYSYTREKGILRIVTNGLWTPMSFYQGEALTGEFIEIMNGFCASQGYIPRYETAVMSAERFYSKTGVDDLRVPRHSAEDIIPHKGHILSGNIGAETFDPPFELDISGCQDHFPRSFVGKVNRRFSRP